MRLYNHKSSEFKIQKETQEQNGSKIVKIEGDRTPDIKNYEFETITGPSPQTYNSVKAKFGPLSSTDAERLTLAQRERRFSLNPLLKDPLSVSQEERRVMDEKVRKIITEIAEKEKKEAHAEGYEEGKKLGFEEAYKKLQLEAGGKLEQFNRLVDSFENAKSEIFRINERMLIEMVFRISKMVILKDLSVDQEYILRLAKELIDRVGAKENITIRISHLDGEILGLLKNGIDQAFGKMNNLNIELNSRVKPGGCEIETEWNALNAGIDSQLQEIHRSLIAESQGDA